MNSIFVVQTYTEETETNLIFFIPVHWLYLKGMVMTATIYIICDISEVKSFAFLSEKAHSEEPANVFKTYK